MELDDFPGRFKAAKLLATPSSEEEDTRAAEGVRRIHGVTTPEVAARINQSGLSYATLRNMENGIKQPEERDIWAIARALELPMEFFLLTRRQLAGALATADVGELLAPQDRGTPADQRRSGAPLRPATGAEGGR